MATKTPTATKQTRKAKNAAEIKADLEKLKQRLAAAEAKEFGADVERMVKELNIASNFNVIKANVKGANDMLILNSIAKVVGIKRVQITQSEPVPRAKKAKA